MNNTLAFAVLRLVVSVPWSIMLLALSSGCGTVVGNPKKPKDPSPPPAVVYQLPKINLELPESATTDDDSAGLLLLAPGDGTGSGEKTLLTGWARRFARTLKEVDRLSDKLNRIVEKERETNQDEALVFTGRGDGGKLSGRIGTITGDADYAYEAVVCHDQALFLHFRWSADGKRISLVRDFAPDADGSEHQLDVKSAITIQAGDSLVVDMRLHGSGVPTGDAEEDGDGYAEGSRMVRDAAGNFTVRAVADKFAEQPASQEYEGDLYLVGRLTPRDGVTASGKPRYAAEFVGYGKGQKTWCANGFDEDATNLWAPTFAGPRFCLGKPAGGRKFKSWQDFQETVAGLEPVGIQSRKTLAPVAFPDGLACP